MPPPAAATAASPVPSTESWFSGSIDVGETWRSDVGGSFDAYRSIVNLGSGPKLIGADFTILDPKHRLFDEIRVRASGWGDDPYQIFHLDAKKSKVYDFSADYRDIAYFDFLPSYADPCAAGARVSRSTSNRSTRAAISAAIASICFPAAGSFPTSPMIATPARVPA